MQVILDRAAVERILSNHVMKTVQTADLFASASTGYWSLETLSDSRAVMEFIEYGAGAGAPTTRSRPTTAQATGAEEIPDAEPFDPLSKENTIPESKVTDHEQNPNETPTTLEDPDEIPDAEPIPAASDTQARARTRQKGDPANIVPPGEINTHRLKFTE